MLAPLLLVAPPAGATCTLADPDLDGRRYPARVAHCRRHVPPAIRRRVMRGMAGCAEVDHLVPLAIGGSNAITNLWCQSAEDAARKDVLESALYRGLLAGTITQAEAIGRIYLHVRRTPWPSASTTP